MGIASAAGDIARAANDARSRTTEGGVESQDATDGARDGMRHAEHARRAATGAGAGAGEPIQAIVGQGVAAHDAVMRAIAARAGAKRGTGGAGGPRSGAVEPVRRTIGVLEDTSGAAWASRDRRTRASLPRCGTSDPTIRANGTEAAADRV